MKSGSLVDPAFKKPYKLKSCKAFLLCVSTLIKKFE